MAIGSVLWGWSHTDRNPAALTGGPRTRADRLDLKFKLAITRYSISAIDWPMPPWPRPLSPTAVRSVTIEYRVQPNKRAEFVTAMSAVVMRRRNGAYFWELFTSLPIQGSPSNASSTNRGLSTCGNTSAQAADREIRERARCSWSKANRPNPLTGWPSGERPEVRFFLSTRDVARAVRHNDAVDQRTLP